MRNESVLIKQYLEPMAHFHAALNAAVQELCSPLSTPLNWDDHIRDFELGIPLLQSSTVTVNFAPAEAYIGSVIGELPSKHLPAVFRENCRILKVKFDNCISGQITSWLFEPEVFPDVDSGLLYLVGWTVLAHYLQPTVVAFSRWQYGERWSRHYCPTCGASPGMAQLIGADPGRLRFLVCGRCRCRWKFPRTACPFCSSDGDHRLAVLALQGEDKLRIDYCEQCAAYLKTYNGAGQEDIMLADWTSIHLDILALQRDLRRVGTSLYRVSATENVLQHSTR